MISGPWLESLGRTCRRRYRSDRSYSIAHFLTISLSPPCTTSGRLTLVTVFTVLARITLSTDTDDISDLDGLVDLVSDSEDLSDNLVADDLRVHLGHISPTGRRGMQVTGTDSTVLDLDCIIST